MNSILPRRIALALLIASGVWSGAAGVSAGASDAGAGAEPGEDPAADSGLVTPLVPGASVLPEAASLLPATGFS